MEGCGTSGEGQLCFLKTTQAFPARPSSPAGLCTCCFHGPDAGRGSPENKALSMGESSRCLILPLRSSSPPRSGFLSPGVYTDVRREFLKYVCCFSSVTVIATYTG